jgi:Family of unknown function (DUF5522)
MSEPENESATTNETASQTFVEGTDFYFDNGLMVLTGQFLKKRGYCCGSGCRHCPYSDEDRAAALKEKLL